MNCKRYLLLLVIFSSLNLYAAKSPKLIYPIDNATINTLYPVFSWKFKEKQDLHFEIKIAEDQYFKINLREFSTKLLNFHCNVPYLKPGKSYYWSVRAIYSDNRGRKRKTEWSHEKIRKISNYHFTILDNAKGIYGFRPELISPEHKAELNTLKPVFEWSFPDYKTAPYNIKNNRGEWVSPEFKNINYLLSISTSSDFTENVKNFQVKPNQQSLSFSIPYLKNGYNYYWKVKASYLDPLSGEVLESQWSSCDLDMNNNAPGEFKVNEGASSAFSFEEGMIEEIYDKYDLNSVEKITSGDDNCFYPAVSMDGKYLSYVSDKLERFELFVKNLDERMGSGETRKTNSQKNKMNFSPFWLHNDREVGFFSNRYNDKYWHLFTSNRGTGVTILTTGLDITENTENFNLFGSCSTDGRIVFTVKFPQDELYLLYLLDLNDNSLTQLRPGMFPDIRDDDRIVFSSDETGNFEIWMVQLEGRSVFRPTILTSNPSYDFDPALSPDGSMIAFASNRSGNTDIWVMNSDGTNLRQITYHPMADRRPQWVNSQEVIFQSNRGLDKDGNPVTNIYKIRVGR